MEVASRRPRLPPGSVLSGATRWARIHALTALTLGGGLLALAVLAVWPGPAGRARAAPNLRAVAAFQRRPDPAILALARRLDGARGPRLGGRAEGWAVLDLGAAPTLGFTALSPQDAERINAWLPSSGEAPSPAAPFWLHSTGAERERAILCLTQAIYYEAALEPTPGQEAVAQAVLNRVRNPDFPRSICGVVYQGSSHATGCQFTFTCDGSRDRPPVAAFWNRARQVAEQAVSGFVMAEVGTATHYHADYVFPRWEPTLVKIRQIGAHIFYRFPGPAGQLASFHAPYLGGELAVSMAGPSPEAILAARAGGGAAAPETTGEAEAVFAPPVPAGRFVFGRRVPTKDEIARINASLAAMEKAPTAGEP